MSIAMLQQMTASVCDCVVATVESFALRPGYIYYNIIAGHVDSNAAADDCICV